MLFSVSCHHPLIYLYRYMLVLILSACTRAVVGGVVSVLSGGECVVVVVAVAAAVLAFADRLTNRLTDRPTKQPRLTDQTALAASVSACSVSVASIASASACSSSLASATQPRPPSPARRFQIQGTIRASQTVPQCPLACRHSCIRFGWLVPRQFMSVGQSVCWLVG